MKDHWYPITDPPIPGGYWTIRVWYDPPDKSGVRVKHTQDTGWQRWDGETWSGDQPTHYAVEATVSTSEKKNGR